MSNITRLIPAESATAVTPSDSTVISPTRALYVGATGDVKVDMADGTTVTYANLAAGIIHPLSVTRVYSTDTTATSIIAVR